MVRLQQGHWFELARSFEEWCFNSLEPQKVEAMPQRVEHLGQKCRRLKKKTLHANVLTRFGNITLTRATYRQGSRGRTIAPLEKILGIECGATPGAQDLVGRQVAAAGSSQGGCIDVIAERTGARIGPEKLHNLSSHPAEIMGPQREACQVPSSGSGGFAGSFEYDGTMCSQAGCALQPQTRELLATV